MTQVFFAFLSITPICTCLFLSVLPSGLLYSSLSSSPNVCEVNMSVHTCIPPQPHPHLPCTQTHTYPFHCPDCSCVIPKTNTCRTSTRTFVILKERGRSLRGHRRSGRGEKESERKKESVGMKLKWDRWIRKGSGGFCCAGVRHTDAIEMRLFFHPRRREYDGWEVLMWFRVNSKKSAQSRLRGGSIQRDDRERGGDSAATSLWRKTLCCFFFSLDYLVLAYVCAILFQRSVGGRVEEVEGYWEGDGEARGNCCSALLGWAHTGEGDRERIPHFSSTTLQQCRDFYNNGTPAPSQLCYWSVSGNPTYSQSVILTSH